MKSAASSTIKKKMRSWYKNHPTKVIINILCKKWKRNRKQLHFRKNIEIMELLFGFQAIISNQLTMSGSIGWKPTYFSVISIRNRPLNTIRKRFNQYRKKTVIILFYFNISGLKPKWSNEILNSVINRYCEGGNASNL